METQIAGKKFLNTGRFNRYNNRKNSKRKLRDLFNKLKISNLICLYRKYMDGVNRFELGSSYYLFEHKQIDGTFEFLCIFLKLH